MTASDAVAVAAAAEPAAPFRETLRDVWARARARARVGGEEEIVNSPAAATDSDIQDEAEAVAVASAFARARATLGTDARSWWLLAEEPPSLTGWLVANREAVARIPDASLPFRVAWIVDTWVTGSIFLAISTAMFLAGAGLRWASRHPLRRWAVIGTIVVTVAGFIAL